MLEIELVRLKVTTVLIEKLVQVVCTEIKDLVETRVSRDECLELVEVLPSRIDRNFERFSGQLNTGDAGHRQTCASWRIPNRGTRVERWFVEIRVLRPAQRQHVPGRNHL